VSICFVLNTHSSSFSFLLKIYCEEIMYSIFYILVTEHLVIIPINDQLDAQFFLCIFISILYMFRATLWSSSGESTVSIQHLLYVTLCMWPSVMQVGKFLPDLQTGRSYIYLFISGRDFLICIPDGHIHRVTYNRCCIDTIVSPDDGHRVTRNM
jgi:hypothetical protein